MEEQFHTQSYNHNATSKPSLRLPRGARESSDGWLFAWDFCVFTRS